MLSDNVKRYLALIDTLKTIQTNKSSSIEDDENKILDISPYWPTMHVLGYENNNLIVLFQPVDDSPGPCSSPWLMGWKDRAMRNMMTLDLTDPYGGFTEYTPSDGVIDMAEDAVDECEDLM